jgi:A/G-specific adenine glycosylase
MEAFAPRLLNWFDAHGRKDLPWQQDINPYRVWVSEIMLQQTQVSTVIPYFNRFMETFPSVQSLATASQDQVLHLWTGLGYYSRARNLHKAAKIVCQEHLGEFPDSLDQLQNLPGIGRSTAGAILSIAFNQPVSILDGNVKRVLARHFAIAGWPGQTAVANQLWQLANELTPDKRVADYTQAIMDLGATLCTRTKPDCPHCPMKTTCKGYQEGTPTAYPGKKPSKTLPVRQRIFAIFINPEGHILLQKRPSCGLWGGLWTFPEIDHNASDTNTPVHELAAQLHCRIEGTQNLVTRRHTFSHFHLDYTPVIVEARQEAVLDRADLIWYNTTLPNAIGTPAPVQKLIKELVETA